MSGNLITVFLLLVLALAAGTAYLLFSRRQLKDEIRQRRAAEDQLSHNLEQLLAAKEEKQTFLDMISHEYRTPLAIIQNSCSILEAQIGDSISNAQSKFASIEKAIQRLVALIETIPGKPRNPAPDTPIGGIFYSLTDAIVALQIIYPNRFHLTRCVDDEIYINTTPEILSTCVDNVISNAAKYSDGADVEIITRMDERFIHIEVNDQGRGIAADELEHIFDRYYRGRDSDPRQSMGLGLYLVKLYTEGAGGHIDITSQEGVGTTVTLAFPYVSADHL